MGGSLRRQKRRDASAPRKKTLCSASVSFFDAVFRSVERFKSKGTGSAAPLRTGRAAATAASAGQGTTKPSEQIDARECEQDNDYGRLHDVSPQTECASVLCFRATARFLLQRPFSASDAFPRREEGFEETLSKMKIIFKHFFSLSAFFLLTLRQGCSFVRRKENDGGDEAFPEIPAFRKRQPGKPSARRRLRWSSPRRMPERLRGHFVGGDSSVAPASAGATPFRLGRRQGVCV